MKSFDLVLELFLIDFSCTPLCFLKKKTIHERNRPNPSGRKTRVCGIGPSRPWPPWTPLSPLKVFLGRASTLPIFFLRFKIEIDAVHSRPLAARNSTQGFRVYVCSGITRQKDSCFWSCCPKVRFFANCLLFWGVFGLCVSFLFLPWGVLCRVFSLPVLSGLLI